MREKIKANENKRKWRAVGGFKKRSNFKRKGWKKKDEQGRLRINKRYDLFRIANITSYQRKKGLKKIQQNYISGFEKENFQF